MDSFRPDYISTRELARHLGVTQATVINRIKKGVIEAVRIGRSYAIPHSYIAAGTSPYQIHRTEDTDYLSIMEAARLLGITRMAVYNRIRKGQLAAERVGRHFVIARDALATRTKETVPSRRYVSLPQYAKQVGLSRVAVWKKVKDGQLSAKRVGGRHFIAMEQTEYDTTAAEPRALQDYRSVPEVARELGISRIAVFKRIQKGRIKAVKVGRSYLIPKEKNDT